MFIVRTNSYEKKQINYGYNRVELWKPFLKQTNNFYVIC